MDERWDNDLNKRIKEVFDNYEDPSADEGWRLLREKYPEKAKRRIAGWWWLGSAAALLLLFIGIFWYRSGSTDNNQPLTNAVKPKQKDTTAQIASNNVPKHDSALAAPKSNKPEMSHSDQNTVAKNNATITLKPAKKNSDINPAASNVAQNTLAQTGKKPERKDQQVQPNRDEAPNIADVKTPANQPATVPGVKKDQNILPKDNSLIANNQQKNNPQIQGANPNPVKIDTGVKSPSSNAQYTVNMPHQQTKKSDDMFSNTNLVDNKTAPKKTVDRGKAISVGVYAATYYNYARGSSNQFNVGGGITSDIRIVGNLKLSTGVAIGQNSLSYSGQVPPTPSASSNDLLAANSTAPAAARLYTASAPQFKSYDASLVDLDIPVNLKYVFSNKSNTYILAGISSGTFISETYTYSFNNPSLFNASVSQVQNQSTSNNFSGFYFAKTLNLAFGTGYAIGHSQLIVEPFVKYPLDGLGSQQLKFGAGGVNLKFDFNLKKK